MAFEDKKAELLLPTRMQNQPQDRHELYELQRSPSLSQGSPAGTWADVYVATFDRTEQRVQKPSVLDLGRSTARGERQRPRRA